MNLVGAGGAARAPAGTGGAAGAAAPAAPGKLGTNGLLPPANLQLKTQLANATYINLISWQFITNGEEDYTEGEKEHLPISSL